jgi:aryl carrier-like protein
MLVNDARQVITQTFLDVLEGTGSKCGSELSDDMVLLESGLDSLGFAILVARLEEEQGWDPFSAAETPYYPQRFGEFIAFYESNMTRPL